MVRGDRRTVKVSDDRGPGGTPRPPTGSDGRRSLEAPSEGPFPYDRGMDSGRCRRCGRPFTAGEITGIGILRTRPEHRGGPVIEFPCPECRTVIQLIPHGNGRYALPGQPPPPPPTDAERVIPWQRPPAAAPGTTAPKSGEGEGSTPPKSGPASTSARPPAPPADPRGAAPPPSGRPAPPRADAHPKDGATTEPPLTALRACDALGLTPTASSADVEKAFRERALLCHPDKVAHLDPEFVALAERKFRRLQEARDLLLGVVDRSDGAQRG